MAVGEGMGIFGKKAKPAGRRARTLSPKIEGGYELNVPSREVLRNGGIEIHNTGPADYRLEESYRNKLQKQLQASFKRLKNVTVSP